LECLAVVWSVKLFRPYLYGRAFGIITDHAALKWLMTRPNLAGRLHRWSLTLQEYEFTIEYRPGTTNVVADALSRAPAAVRAVVGERRRPGRPAVRATRPDAAMETKAEDDEPVTTPVSRGNGMDEAMAAALAALGTTGDTAKPDRMVAAERREVPGEGNGSAKSGTPFASGSTPDTCGEETTGRGGGSNGKSGRQLGAGDARRSGRWKRSELAPSAVG